MFSHGTFTDVVLQARNQNHQQQQHRPSSLWTYRVVSRICRSKKKNSACEICVPLFAGNYRLAHTPKSFVACASITLEACSVRKHRNDEVQSAVTCALVE